MTTTFSLTKLGSFSCGVVSLCGSGLHGFLGYVNPDYRASQGHFALATTWALMAVPCFVAFVWALYKSEPDTAETAVKCSCCPTWMAGGPHGFLPDGDPVCAVCEIKYEEGQKWAAERMRVRAQSEKVAS